MKKIEKQKKNAKIENFLRIEKNMEKNFHEEFLKKIKKIVKSRKIAKSRKILI